MLRKLLAAAISVVAVFIFVVHFVSASTTAVLLPQSDGHYLQLTPSTGSVHYTMVNETRCNGTTNYNSTGTITVTARDSYGISVTSTPGMGNGSLISQIAIVPCASLNSGTGSATSMEFYRWNGVDAADFGAHSVSGTTPVGLATSTVSGLNLFKTSTSVLEIGAVMSTTGSKGFRLSRIATVLTYSLTVPTAPSNLVANNSSSSVNALTWTDNSNNELGFKIYRAQNGGAYSQVATTVTWNVTSYTDSGLTADQTYSYQVIAFNDAGTSTSNTATSITYSTVPKAPSNLNTSTSSNNVILTWDDNSSNEDGFKIERSTDNVTYTQIGTASSNTASTDSYTDSGAAGTPYYYRVRAYNTIGNSAYASGVEGIYKTNVTNIYANTTWTPANIFYINSVLSVTGYTLTINPGTIVKFDGSSGLSVTSAGVLNVPGTGGGTAYFTSYKDDSEGGDTNHDTTSTVPNPGDWGNIEIDYGASSTISHASVQYGGSPGGNLFMEIYDNGGILTLDTVEAANSNGRGIEQHSGTLNVLNSNVHSQSVGAVIEGGTATFSSNTFQNCNPCINGDNYSNANLTITNNTFTNVTDPIEFDLGSGVQFTHSGNTVSGTGSRHGFELTGKTGGNETLSSGDGFPYIISNTLTVATGTTLTINPGAILKFDTGATMEVAGTMVAEGTTATSYFTSLPDDSIGGDTNNDGPTVGAAGNWTFLKFDTNASSTIANALIRYGGSSPGNNPEIYNNGGTLTLV